MTDDRQPTTAPRVAVLGAGHSGPVIARMAVEAGYPVAIAASGDPASIALISQVLIPGAEPRWAADAVADADIVVLAIPIHRFAAFNPDLVAGRSIDSFPLFGYDLANYETLFEEKTNLFAELLKGGPVTWQALESFGRAPLPVGVHSPGHVAATDEQAREEFWPYYLEVLRLYSRIRGFAIPTKESFLREIGPGGALHVGSPETVAQKVAQTLTSLGANRFDLKYGMGGLNQQALLTNIELYGSAVVPRVRELLEDSTVAVPG